LISGSVERTAVFLYSKMSIVQLFKSVWHMGSRNGTRSLGSHTRSISIIAWM